MNRGLSNYLGEAMVCNSPIGPFTELSSAAGRIPVYVVSYSISFFLGCSIGWSMLFFLSLEWHSQENAFNDYAEWLQVHFDSFQFPELCQLHELPIRITASEIMIRNLAKLDNIIRVGQSYQALLGFPLNDEITGPI